MPAIESKSNELSVSDDYPRPTIPLKPVLSLGSFIGRASAGIPSILDAGTALYVTSGRAAIALALRDMGIAGGDRVLVPAFHCTSMIEPVIWASAEPVFYRVRNDTSIDLDDAKRKLSPSARALLVTHYFGFPQDMKPVQDFCNKHNLVLIEDCAHAFFGEHNGQPLGSFGQYAITSAMKFFPIYDGGCLVSRHASLRQIRLDAGGLAFEAKSTVNVLEYALEYGRLRAARYLLKAAFALKDVVWRGIKSRRSESNAHAIGPGASDGEYAFDPKWLTARMSGVSRFILRTASRSRIIVRRRQNFSLLLHELSGIPGATPLFPRLPEGVVPYVFPLLVDAPERVFPTLKQQGVPILRFGEYLWRGVDASVCPVAAEFSRRLLQFPCHQELRQTELAWMITRVREALLERPAFHARPATVPT